MPDKPENSAFKLLSSRKTLVMATADKNGTPNVSLSPAFAAPAAYGDLVATILAIFATFGLAAHASWAIGVVWLLNVWGTGDLLYAFYTGFTSFGGDPGVLGAAFFIPTLVVPLLLMTHGMMFWLLLRS